MMRLVAVVVVVVVVVVSLRKIPPWFILNPVAWMCAPQRSKP
jgi:hypothetical protein